jgi:CubicO group peptidase (beta-lactamase class C family)
MLKPFVFLAFAGLPGLLLAQPATGIDVAAKADAQAAAYFQQDRFQGSVLVAKGGKILLSKGYGMANEEHEVPNKGNTKFRLGSITKQFTAVSILQLQEKGKLNVQDSITKYIPNSPEAWKPVTIHHLLSHTGGVPSYTSMAEYGKRMREDSSKPLEFIARFKDKPLDFAPGSKHAYSNSGYFLLGVIIEQVSGKSYEQYLRENIFDKVDMQDSGYDWDYKILKNRATGYDRDADGKHRNAPYLDMGQPYAAGSLYSTVEDLYRWDRALYTEKVLSKKSLEAAWTPVMNNYGYGWVMGKILGEHRTISHGGGINGFSTMMIRLPDDDAFVAVFSNLETRDSGRLANEIAQIVLGQNVQPPVERKAISVAPEILEKYTGKYEIGPMKFDIISGKTALVVAAEKQPTLRFEPESESKFFTKAIDAQFSFADVENGKAQKITLHQNGREMVGKRVQ